jgi:hypothetical protein
MGKLLQEGRANNVRRKEGKNQAFLTMLKTGPKRSRSSFSKTR